VANKSEWTILVFLNAKNSLEPFAFPNFQQMTSVGSTPEVKLVVEMGRPKKHLTTQYGAWSKTLRFVIEKGKTQPIEKDAVADLGATNMGDAKSLIDFVAWGRKTFPSKRTMLVIWNHGQGWRAPQDPNGLPPPPAATPHAGHRYVSNDDDTGDKLYNRAIQDALTSHLAGERLDLVAFDACLMSMVETTYALRDVGNVMVGSEELEPGNGWNYTRWLQPLTAAKGNLGPAELARLLVQSMKDEYGDTDATTLAATDLHKVPALASAISAFATAAIPHLASELAAFRAARDACLNYAPGYGLNSIDLGHYMERIVANGLPPELKQRANAVRDALKASVIENYASKLRKGNWGSNGIAIYYPATAATYQSDPDGGGYAAANTVFPVEFVERESWASFLRQYWTLVP
jgi:Clostripain family